MSLSNTQTRITELGFIFVLLQVLRVWNGEFAPGHKSVLHCSCPTHTILLPAPWAETGYSYMLKLMKCIKHNLLFSNKIISSECDNHILYLGRREGVDSEVAEVCGRVCTNDWSFVSSYWCCCNFCGLRVLFFFIRLKDLIRKMGTVLNFCPFFPHFGSWANKKYFLPLQI